MSNALLSEAVEFFNSAHGITIPPGEQRYAYSQPEYADLLTYVYKVFALKKIPYDERKLSVAIKPMNDYEGSKRNLLVELSPFDDSIYEDS